MARSRDDFRENQSLPSDFERTSLDKVKPRRRFLGAGLKGNQEIVRSMGDRTQLEYTKAVYSARLIVAGAKWPPVHNWEKS
jgi:hypothetical protein